MLVPSDKISAGVSEKVVLKNLNQLHAKHSRKIRSKHFYVFGFISNLQSLTMCLLGTHFRRPQRARFFSFVCVGVEVGRLGVM